MKHAEVISSLATPIQLFIYHFASSGKLHFRFLFTSCGTMFIKRAVSAGSAWRQCGCYVKAF